MRVRLIRHGTTAGNAARRYVGRTDDPLCPEGREAAERHEKDPAQKSVFVSPLKRARETAAILFPNAEQIIVDGLMEMDFGDFEGRTADEMADDPAYRKWVDDFCEGACPNGESQEGFFRRVTEAFGETLASLDSDALFVVHGGVIMAIMTAMFVTTRRNTPTTYINDALSSTTTKKNKKRRNNAQFKKATSRKLSMK